MIIFYLVMVPIAAFAIALVLESFAQMFSDARRLFVDAHKQWRGKKYVIIPKWERIFQPQHKYKPKRTFSNKSTSVSAEGSSFAIPSQSRMK